ncbi:MAG: DegT/DnrJ/EryC1/StrS family aminotransferase [Bacteriovoracaceae bacterium]|nr:DegT/DnrJ/EryC1/StrS family aminotransferase [Bacteriovoracaceae bacterium]
MISVGRPYLPNKKKLYHLLDKIYANTWLTNNGPLSKELRQKLGEFLGVENLLLCANGTLALQIAYKALGVRGKALTTPFSFIATASSLEWEGIPFGFSDINPCTFNLDFTLAESSLSSGGFDSIVPVHVFGNPCDVEDAEMVAERHNLKVIYDAAHAFNVKYKNKSVLSFGDASTLSFHATKLFHCTEGGAVVFKKKEDLETAERLINFGFDENKEIRGPGINAKMSEIHAAMGLAVLDDFHLIQERVQQIANHYRDELKDYFMLQVWNEGSSSNNSYFPIVCKSEEELRALIKEMNDKNIYPRQYFSPSLDTLGYSSHTSGKMLKSIEIASKIICLPIYPEMSDEDVKSVVRVLKK